MLVRVVAAAAAFASLAVLLGPAAAAAQTAGAAGHVYVLNNNPAGPNSITTFARGADGNLSQQGVTPIGGVGSITAFADGTQGSLVISRDGKRLFAADPGSNQISVVDIQGDQLTLAGVFGSGGAGPISLTYADGLLYVLNAANGDTTTAANVAGFRVSGDGRLTSIPGAIRPLTTDHPNPAQVLYDPQRQKLLVTEKRTDVIDVYGVAGDGSLTGPKPLASSGRYPFGMALASGSSTSELVVDDGMGPGPNGTGAVTTYTVADRVTQLQGPVLDHQIAPCWMVVTRDGRFAYTSNADSQAISGFRIAADGGIALLNADGVTAATPAGTFPIEEALTRDSQFLYVIDSRLLLPTPGPGTLGGYRIQENGELTPVVDPTTISIPLSAFGLAAD
jgi:6-phosphogluconolactonase (cycloisomerase 2 family)